MSDTKRILRESFAKNISDYAVLIAAIAVVLMIIIPIPAVLLDALMALNLALSLMILLITFTTKSAVEFSIFPTLLLVTTIFSLALNISSTRLILSKGQAFDGRMVRAFSSFVVGTDGTQGLVIGFIIFVIIIAVQAIVISKGSTRISEVAARFSLDGMATKQMSIENEYSSGAITEEEARRQKANLLKESNFYGQMDGASKFVSGNVTIGIFISVINLIGGFVVGMVLDSANYPSVTSVLATFTSLTIGDGLVSQLPSLLVSTATGIIVSRGKSDGTFGEEAIEQFTKNSRIYWVAAAVLFLMAFLPGFPWYVLIFMAGLFAYIGWSLSKKEVLEKDKAQIAQKEGENKKTKAPMELSPIQPPDPISLELGCGLLPLADKDKGAELLERVIRIRRETAMDMGLVVPQIRIVDNIKLEPSEYCFKMRGTEMGRGIVRPSYYLAISPGNVTEEIEGEKTKDPTFGLPAVWVSEANRDKAERAGYTVVDAPSIIATHLTEIIKRNASELVGKQEIQKMMEALKRDYPAVVDETQKNLSLGEIQKVLQGLLREQVSIRNLVSIMETLSDYAGVTKDIGFLIEKSRQALSRQICYQYADDNKLLNVLTIDPGLEQSIIDSRVNQMGTTISALEPGLHRKWIKALSIAIATIQKQGYFPLILCSEAARALVKSSTEREIPDLVVLSVKEITPDIRVESIGEIKIEG